MLAFVRERESEFVELLAKKKERDLNRPFRKCSRELEQATQRITRLDSIIQRLYEDNLDGKISDDRFDKMTSAYEQEQKDLQSRVIALRETLSKAKAQRLNIDSFLAQVRKYTGCGDHPSLGRTHQCVQDREGAGYQNEKADHSYSLELHWSSRTAPRLKKSA